MTDVETDVREALRRAAAPVGPSESLAARVDAILSHDPRRRRQGAILGGVGLLAAALLAVALVGRGDEPGVVVDVGNPSGSVSYVPTFLPAGLVLVDTTERTDAAGVVSTSQKYARTAAPRAVVDVRVATGLPDAEIDRMMAADEAELGGRRVTVRGKSGVLQGAEGDGLIVLRWREGSDLMLTLTARGTITVDEVLAVADSLRHTDP